MTSIPSPKAASSRRNRKSIAHFPTSDLGFNKENAEHGTSSTGVNEKISGKKPRSKSLGPGGLDALKQDAGNKQKVNTSRDQSCGARLLTSIPVAGATQRKVDSQAHDNIFTTKADPASRQFGKNQSR